MCNPTAVLSSLSYARRGACPFVMEDENIAIDCMKQFWKLKRTVKQGQI
jgi:hypothetical protein